MKFGVREICDVVLRAKTAQKIGNKIFFKNEPVCYFDTLKTSTFEGAATTVYATGGRGNARLMSWDGERTITFTMEDALISPVGLSILTGAGLIDASMNTPVIIHTTEQIALNHISEDTNGFPIITLSSHPYELNTENSIYVMGLNEHGEVITEPYLYTLDLTDGASGNNIRYALKGTYSNVEFLSDGNVSLKDCETVLVDYYVAKTSSAMQVDITPDKFGGTFYLEASTLWRDQGTGKDLPAEFIIPSCKVQSNFSFSMSSSGDPSTFTFTLDAFPDYTRWDKTKKVLATIQLVGSSLDENKELFREETYAQMEKYDVDPETLTISKKNATTFIKNAYFKLPIVRSTGAYSGEVYVELTDQVPTGAQITISHIVDQNIAEDEVITYIYGNETAQDDNITVDLDNRTLKIDYAADSLGLSSTHAFRIMVDNLETTESQTINLGSNAWNSLPLQMNNVGKNASWNFKYTQYTVPESAESIVIQDYFVQGSTVGNYTKLSITYDENATDAQKKTAIKAVLDAQGSNKIFVRDITKIGITMRFPYSNTSSINEEALAPLAIHAIKAVFWESGKIWTSIGSSINAVDARKMMSQASSSSAGIEHTFTIDWTKVKQETSMSPSIPVETPLTFEDIQNAKVTVYIRTTNNDLWMWVSSSKVKDSKGYYTFFSDPYKTNPGAKIIELK